MRVTKSKVLGLALNIMNNCNVCRYCWNRELNKRYGRYDNLKVDTDIEELMRQLERGRLPAPYPPEQCQFYTNEGHDILLGAKTEFFYPKPDARQTSQNVLRLLEAYPEVGNRLRVLTKQDIFGRYMNILPDKCMVGCTVTTTNEELAKSVEPYAAPPKDRMTQLKEFHEVGFKTWVVVEPFFRFMRLSELLNELSFVDEMWVGRLNAGRRNRLIDGKFAGFTCGEMAAPDDLIVSEVVSNIRWMREPVQFEIVGSRKHTEEPHQIKSKMVPNPKWNGFKLYPKREVIRLIERAGLIDVIDADIVASARAKNHT